jgi:heme oxygenase
VADRGAAHAALRTGTAADHARLDGLFAGFDLADPVAYRAFLTAHAMALPAVERALDEADFDSRLADWPERRRTAALADDLAALGAALPDPLPAPALPGPAACWGAAYVVEGSRLGGAMLARRVGEGLPRSYLGTPLAPGAWRHFLGELDRHLATPAEQAEAVQAANAVFALFETAGRLFAGETIA